MCLVKENKVAMDGVERAGDTMIEKKVSEITRSFSASFSYYKDCGIN